MILNDDFLKKLYEDKEGREVFAKIIVLSSDDLPLEEISGKVQSGGITIDGQSSVRRTCQLSLVSHQDTVNDYYWALNNKFTLEVGLANRVDNRYPDIIWFKQGYYVITSFNLNQNTNSYSISISGKDKMCLLNGEIGGALPQTVDFGTYEEVEKKNGEIISSKIQDVPIKRIIRESVQEYGNESPENIIINDIDDYGLEVLEYRGKSPLYLYKNVITGVVTQATLNSNQSVYLVDKDKEISISYEEISISNIPKYDKLIDLVDNLSIETPSIVKQSKDSGNEFTIIKIETGGVPGYRRTELTYPGELVGNAGEALSTAALDKIKQMLGNFEYFYDKNGKFIFQKKQQHANVNLEFLEKEDIKEKQLFMEPAIYQGGRVYNLYGNKIVSSLQNTPNLQNVKNDFSIWGKRKTAGSIEMAIHLRYAIGYKPTKYTLIDDPKTTFIANDYAGAEEGIRVDWRELVYRMAIDYRNNIKNDNYITKLRDANPEYYNGKTGYEQYYTDMEAFWRNLYDYDPEKKKGGWKEDVLNHPELLNFWFDLLEGNLGQYSTNKLGDRAKVINDDKINSIYNREIPTVLFTKPGESAGDGYTRIQMQDYLEGLFTISSIGKSAVEVLQENLQMHSYCTETVNIQTLPLYHLEPNDIILLEDEKTKIQGEYSINKLTIPLAYNGMMTIQATKVENSII